VATVFQTHKKSITGGTVRMYPSKCLVVSGEREAKGKF